MRTYKTATKTISIKNAMRNAQGTMPRIGQEIDAARKAEAEAAQAETRKLTEKQAKARERRQQLRALCNALQAAAKAAGIELAPNELLRRHYAQKGHTDLRTFEQWKKDGYNVLKGAKAIVLWGHPKPSKQAREAAKEQGKAEEEADNDFYPLAYLFSNLQVQPQQPR